MYFIGPISMRLVFSSPRRYVEEVVEEAPGDLGSGGDLLLPADLKVVVLCAVFHEHHSADYHGGESKPIASCDPCFGSMSGKYCCIGIMSLTDSQPGLKQYVRLQDDLRRGFRERLEAPQYS